MSSVIERQRREIHARSLAKSFGEALCTGDRQNLYSCLHSEYQKIVPFNQFMATVSDGVAAAEAYEIGSIDADPGIREIWIQLRVRHDHTDIELTLRALPDYGGWKLDASSLEPWML